MQSTEHSKLLSIGIGMISVVLIVSIIMVFLSTGEPVLSDEVYDSYNITALNDTTRTEGRFYYGTGRIAETDYVVVLKQDTKGFTSIQKLPAKYVKIKEDSNETPRVELAGNKPSKYLVMQIIQAFMNEQTQYFVYVPEGSLSTDFTIDLEK